MRGQRIPRTSKFIFGTLFMSTSVYILQEKLHRCETIFFSAAVCFHVSHNSSLFRNFAVVCCSLLQTPSSVFWGFLGQPEK